MVCCGANAGSLRYYLPLEQNHRERRGRKKADGPLVGTVRKKG